MSLRILHLIKSLGRGGAEMLLPAGFKAKAGDMDFIYGYFLPWKDALVPDLQALGAPVTCFGERSNLAILLKARAVARELKRQQIDLLHCHLPIAGIVGRLAGRMAGVPVVYTEHNKMERYHGVTRRLNVATWRWQAHAIAVSESVADSIRAHAPGHVPLTTVDNGVDVEHFSPDSADGGAVRAHFGIPAADPIVGTVAVFRVQKRLDHWLQAAAAIKAALPSAHFLLVGDGPLRKDVEGWIAEHRLTDCVHLAGLQTEVRPYVAAMDVYQMSSQFEGLPIALLEAMAMARPVVATAVGGIPEVVTGGHSGCLVPAAEPDQLAEAAIALLQDDEAREAMGRAARETVTEKFSIVRMQRQLEAIYREVVETHRAKAVGRNMA